MNRRRKAIVAGSVAVAAIGLGAGIAVAAGGDDASPPATGAALERASVAALSETGGGRVTDSEVGDEQGYYEIEVTRDDGTQVDVHLDRDFSVLSTEQDQAEGADEAD
jgi:uncharacterized membrane protein YkoI